MLSAATVVVCLALVPAAARATMDIPFLLPIEISDIGYLNVKEAGVWVSVPDVDYTFQVGDRLTLLQRNLFYYVALDERDDSPRRLVAVRRQLGDGQGSAWVTEQKDLIFGTSTDTEAGMFYLRPSELLPVVSESDTGYTVLCERHATIFELNVPKVIPGVAFIKHLPKSLVRQLQRREEMRQRIVLREEFGRLGEGPPEVATGPIFHAEKTPPPWPSAAAPVAASPNVAASSASPAAQPLGAAAADGATAPATAPLIRKPRPRPVKSIIPEYVPETPPIEAVQTSRLITELAQAILLTAGNPSPPIQFAAGADPLAPPADFRGVDPVTATGNVVEAEQPVPRKPLAAEQADAEAAELAIADGTPSPAADDAALADEAELAMPDLAMPALITAPESAGDGPVVSGVAGAAVKVLVVVLVATLSFFLVLLIMARMVNRRPAPRLVQTKQKRPAAAPPPVAKPAPVPTLVEPPPVAPRQPTLIEPPASVADQGSSSSTFTGSLHGFHISELIQFLNSTKETGTLTITENDNLNQARVIFDQGEIVNAFYGEMDATESLAEILAFDDGFFVFKRQEEVFAERVIQQSTMSLLMNMHQEIDERVLESPAEPDLDDVFRRAEPTGSHRAGAIGTTPSGPAPEGQSTAQPVFELDDEVDVFRRASAPTISDTILGHSTSVK